MDRVAEERPLSEDHAERSRRSRVDDAAGTRVYAVGPDQEVSLGLRPILEPRHDAPRSGLGIHELLAVLYAGPAPEGLVTQRPVQVGPLEGLADVTVGQGPAVGNAAEMLAG